MEIQIKNLQKSKRINCKQIEGAILKCLQILNISDERVQCSVVLCDDEYMRKLNKLMRKKDKPTDVLSFPQYSFRQLKKALINSQCPVIPLGDIVINMQAALRQTKDYDVSLRDELMRLLVHGLLHLLGYDHEKGVRQAIAMQKKEALLLTQCNPNPVIIY